MLPLLHFFSKFSTLKYNTFISAFSFTNEPFPLVTFLNAEFNDSIGFVVYIIFLISSGYSNNGYICSTYSSVFFINLLFSLYFSLNSLYSISAISFVADVYIFLKSFIIPDASIRLAGGRGLLGDKGRLCFTSGANAAISGDMLTTSGINMQTDMELLAELGFEAKLCND